MVRIRFLLWFFTALTVAQSAFADDAVNVRASAKDDYTRIVFEWPKPPSYVTDKTSSQLTLKFQSAATFTIDGQKPTGLPRVTAYTTPDSKTAVIGFTAGQEVRHYEIGNKVIVDIRGPEAGAVTKPDVKTTDVKTPEAKKEAADIAATNKGIAELKKLEVAEKPIKLENVKVEPVAKAEIAPPKDEAASSAPTTIQVTATEIVGIAVFKRFGNLWIVLDTPDYPIAPQISGGDAKKFGTFERIPLKEATAFRIAMPDDKPYHVEGGGLVWKIISDGIPPGAAATPLQPNADLAAKKRSLLWPVPTARRIIDVADPIVGDTLKVVTVDAAKYYSGPVQAYAELGTLQSLAGLALESRIDDLSVKKIPTGIQIESDEGLSISPDSDTASIDDLKKPPATAAKPGEAPVQKTDAAGSPKIFKFDQWKMGDPEAADQNRRILMSGLVGKSDQGKAQDLLTLAKMELANARGPEARGYLDLATQFVPDLAKTPEFLALHGAATAFSGEYEEALKDFSNDSLKNISEIPLWKAQALAGLEDWKQAADTLPADISLLAAYPDNVRIPLALTLTEVALRDGDLNKAQNLMKFADAKNLILPYKSALDYMQGEALRQQGKTDETEKLWKELKDGKDDLYRAKAGLALTSLQLDKKEITPAAAIDRLEGLRYAWRGDELETSINYKLGQLYVANNEPIKGLLMLRQAAALSPASDQSKRINAEMASTFNALFEPNRIKDINPVDAVSLYNEFSSLAPTGQGGERIARQLADRLVDADLLPRAASILQAQVDSGKLSGVDGTMTAIRLASIYTQDNNAEKALAALGKANAFLAQDGLAAKQPSLVRQVTILKAEALALQKKPEEAFAVLAPLEQNEEVLRLRADIAWKNQRWQDAADSLEALVKKRDISPGRPASAEDASTLLNWAVALYLADNRYVLANVREKFTAAMAATNKAKQFEVVTRPRQSSLLADRDTINAIVDETEIFKGFVESAREENAGASASADDEGARTVEPPKPAVPPITTN